MIHTRTRLDSSTIQRNITSRRNLISNAIKSGIINTLEHSNEYKLLNKIAKSNGSNSNMSVLKAVNDSLLVEVDPINEFGIGQIHIRVKHQKLKNKLVNDVDPYTISKIRKRTHKNAELGWLGTMMDMKDDTCVIVMADWHTGKLTASKHDPNSWDRLKNGFLQSIIYGALEGISEALNVTMGEEI